MEKENLVKKVENNLRFAITISIFFLSIFSEARLEGSMLIVVYMLCYIVFEIRGEKLSARNLKWIKNTLFFGIGSYIVPLFLVGLTARSEIFGSWKVLTLEMSLIVSICFIFMAPISALIMVSFLSDKTWKDIKSFLTPRS